MTQDLEMSSTTLLVVLLIGVAIFFIVMMCNGKCDRERFSIHNPLLPDYAYATHQPQYSYFGMSSTERPVDEATVQEPYAGFAGFPRQACEHGLGNFAMRS